jgi:hypothetical protein
MFTYLIIINSVLQAKENDSKTIQNISYINFILKLEFPNTTYVLNSTDKTLKEEIEKLKDEDFSKLKSRSLGANSFDKSVDIIPDSKISNIRGAFDALFSAITIYHKGHRDLELGSKSKLGITHQDKGMILLSSSSSNNPTTYYQIKSHVLLENLVVFIENLEEILSSESSDYSVFSQTSTKDSQVVTQFLNTQSCFILNQCSEANVRKNLDLQYGFIKLKEDDLALLLLGLNFEAYKYVYSLNPLSSLYFLYFKEATNKESINKVISRFESYINNSSEDPYKSLKELKYLLEKYKYKSYIYNRLLEVDKEFRLKPVFTSDISDMKEKAKRTEKLLKKLIATNDASLPYRTRFGVDILRTEDAFPVDHSLVDYELFYQLFKRAMMEQNIRNAAYYTSVYPGRILEFLSKNYQDKFVESLISDMRSSPKFISALKHQFSFYWGVQEDEQDFYWTFMLKVEEGYNNTSKEMMDSVINNRKLILRQAIKNKIIKKEQSLLRWWQRKYKNKERSPEEFYEAMYKNLKKSSTPKDHAFTVADIFTKLIILEMKNRNFSAGKELIIFYIDKLVPLVGVDEKTTDISSNGLVLSIHSKDEELSQIIFNKLIGEEFKVEEAKNEILVYNLACYHAIHKQKKPMLEAIAQALKLGKKPEQFVKDSDFKLYLEDEDFISILKGK